MTDYIEEMMKTAGIEPEKICANADKFCYDCHSSDEIRLQEKERHYIGDFAICKYDKYSTEKCRNFRFEKEVLPDFTAKKQLEIIKLMIKANWMKVIKVNLLKDIL